MGMLRRIGLLSALAGFAVASNASPATASVTIGQLAPGATTACDSFYDWMPNEGLWIGPADEIPVPSGSYQAPANGTITSWSHLAAPGSGLEMTMKIFRAYSGVTHTSGGVVGHDGPRTLTGGTLNT